jgi:hypothetical protein
MAAPFVLWKEVKTNSFNPNEANTKQPTLENDPHETNSTSELLSIAAQS